MTWSDVDWAATEAVVGRIQNRIFRAAKTGDGARVKNLQKLLVRSRSAKLLAIRQVTQRNAGRNTPGIDGVVCRTPEDRVALLESGLDLKGYKPKPVRRVYIPKANGKMRPLGIPTIRDRMMQAVVKLAMEPEWETRFEANSYGFRPGRCTMDAIEAIFIALGQMGSSRWILDADISGCFDAIAHGPLLARRPTFTRTIERWLKAGSIDMGAWRASEAGTPQGGILSPVLANVALDGMERLFGGEDRDGNPVKAATKKGMDKSVVLIRYADDVLVTAPSKEVLERHVLPRLEAFLADRGLVLNYAKTRIVSIEAGFDFLGFTARKFRDGKLLIRPEKAKVLAHLRAIKAYLDANRQAPAGAVVRALAPVIRGWTLYYRHACSARTFSYADHRVWRMLWAWAGGDTRRRVRDGSRPATSGRPDRGCGTSQTQRCRGRPCCPGTATPRSSATSRSGDAAVPWTPTHDRIGTSGGGGDWRLAPSPGGDRTSSEPRAMLAPGAASRSTRTRTSA